MTANKKILCTGTFIVDIMNEPVEKALGSNEGVRTAIGVYPGGNAFNVSADLVKLGVPAQHIICHGAVGQDLFGEMFTKELKDLGIHTEIRTIPGRNTSKIFMLKVKDEEPRYYLDEGANAFLEPEAVISCLELIRPALFYTGETGHLVRLLGKFRDIMEQAKTCGCLTIVDTVYPQDGNWGFLFESAPFIDLLKCNRYEAYSLTGMKDMRAALNKLSTLGIPLTIISLADRGLLFSYNKACYMVRAFHVPCPDPSGAGDACNAGIIKKLSELEGSGLKDRFGDSEEKLFDTIIFGAAAGASAVTEHGCVSGVSREHVEGLIREQGERLLSGIERF
jgi:sugar/nucleoside kinase (ribokinase family)